MRQVLGYSKFGTAGGDYGALLSSELGFSHSEHLIGVYMMLPMLYGVDSATIKRSDYSNDEAWMRKRVIEIHTTLRSHIAVHSNNPQSLAYALCDSPVGTATWIWERRRAWSDCDGDIVGLHGPDFLCTLASIYWLTNTIGTSLRIYPQIFPLKPNSMMRAASFIRVPTGFGVAPKDVGMMPRCFAEKYTNLRSWDILEKGGHFSPSEQPILVAANLRRFFNSIQ